MGTSDRLIALEDLGRLEQAIASFDKALQIKPDDHGAWFNRGNAMEDLRRLEEALGSWEQSLANQIQRPPSLVQPG
jgi:superkiller protein 3